MYPNREVFTASPLALVAAEIRFTDAARLRQQEVKDSVTIALEGRFPFAEPLQQTDLNFVASAPPQIQQRVGVVLKNVESTETLTVMSESLTYETTAYTTFDDLAEAISTACQALVDAKVRPAMRRVGLRYIDEVRVPAPITNVRDWSRWIDGRLVAHLDVGPDDATPTMTQGVATYDLGDGHGLNFRFAALNQGPVVVPQHLQRPAIESGPFFVLDFDGFHDFAGKRRSVPLSSEVIRTSLAAVHVPCGAAFQRSITDEARTLFRESRADTVGGNPE